MSLCFRPFEWRHLNEAQMYRRADYGNFEAARGGRISDGAMPPARNVGCDTLQMTVKI